MSKHDNVQKKIIDDSSQRSPIDNNHLEILQEEQMSQGIDVQHETYFNV